jgi:hypothetical protein
MNKAIIIISLKKKIMIPAEEYSSSVLPRLSAEQAGSLVRHNNFHQINHHFIEI